MNKPLPKIIVVIPIVIGLLSCFFLGNIMSKPDTYAEYIQQLDDSQHTVMKLSGASTVMSFVLTTMPGDIATSVADKITDISAAFLLITSAIFLEKYLLTITGYVAFRWVIPISCVLFVICVFRYNKSLMSLAKKLVFFAVAIWLLVPVSVELSSMIQDTYRETIQTTIDEALALENTIEETKSLPDETDEDVGWIQSRIGDLKAAVNAAVDGVSDLSAYFQDKVNQFVEAVAVFIVTVCVIPILVMIGFGWLIKSVLTLDFNLSPKSVHENLSSAMKRTQKGLSIPNSADDSE